MDSKPQHPGKLLLVGWDSADWKIIHPLVDAGELPVLGKMLELGVSGNLSTLDPVISPMLWTSIATGRRACDHGVNGFTEVAPDTGVVRPVNAASRTSATLWEMLACAGLESQVVGWFATQGDTTPKTSVVSNLYPHPTAGPGEGPWPPPPAGTYSPVALGEKLDDFRVSPEEVDEEVIGLFVPRFAEVDQERDKRLAKLRIYLAEAFSIQAAATWLLENEPWNFSAVYFRAIDEICHYFMPFHPPRMEGVPEFEFELYKDVINSAYRMHDLMLGRLVELAGPDAAVMLVSDHGFHSDHLRPAFTPDVPAGIAVWHRRHGVVAAAGPGFKSDEIVHGANLLDLAPTILNYFGLPVAREMEGRVLSEAFESPVPPETIASWDESVEALERKTVDLSEADDRAVIDQFVALGYIDPPGDDPSEAAANTIRENHWNLARACLEAGRLEEALPLLEDIYAAVPERVDYAQVLGRCQMRLGLFAEANDTIAGALDAFGGRIESLLILARIKLESKEPRAALDLLEEARHREPDRPDLWKLMALIFIKLRRWEDAEDAARRALDHDPNDAAAWLGVAHSQLRRGLDLEAARSALRAIGLNYAMPLAHFNLGVALLHVGDLDRASEALRVSIRLSPGLIPAHRYLAAVERRRGGDPERTEQDWEKRNRLYRQWREASKHRERLRDESADRARKRRAAREMRRAAETIGPSDPAVASEQSEFIIVSGLPRSGTSLMMQMLDAGGMPVMTDHRRAADESNPEGYLEWEEIRKLPRNPRIIEQTRGKVTKVISMLLPHLPPQHRYRLIFMRRPIKEIASSQDKMLQRSATSSSAPVSSLTEPLAKHLEEILGVLRQAPQIDLLEVDYPALVHDPAGEAGKVAGFLAETGDLDCQKMISVVRPELHRTRLQNAAEEW